MAISDKLTYLNDTKLALKDMINYGLDTGEKITNETTFRNYVRSLFDAFIKTMTYPDVLYDNLPKVTGTGTNVTLNGTAEAPMRNILRPSAISQDGEPSPSNPQDIHIVSGENTITISNSDNTQEQSLPLNLGTLEYCKIRNYEDEFYKATESDTGLTAGKWYLKKNIEKKVFNGTENITTGTTTATRKTYQYTPYNIIEYNNSDDVPNLKTTKFISVSQNATWVAGMITRSTSLKTSLLFVLGPNSTVEELKQIINGQPLYYVLKTPTYTLLNSTLQTQLENIYKAMSYNGQTNVSQENNDLPFVLSLSAIKDYEEI